MAIKLRCPSCRKTFRWEGPWPRYCPRCQYDTSLDDKPEVAAPHISSGRAKALSQSADQTYRGMEAGAQAGAEAAAAALGVPVAEMSGMKITDMNDRLREGDLAMKAPPPNPVSNVMAASPSWGLQGSDAGRGWAEATLKTGPEGRAGARASDALRAFHEANAPAAVRASETHRYAG